MLNDRLNRLSDYPFQRLRDLLGPLTPPADTEALALHLGEPQHTPPAIVARTLAENAHLWGRYPPVDGTAEFRAAVGAWLTRRYGLGEGT
ncbi:MAG: aspartate aminotransferase, partial [Rhodospirillales bacterium]|nr:aspartate aminotransferase [Rhodospirillales bacterium]